MRENGGRRPRFRRVEDFPPLRLTERDKTILSAVRQYRFLTTGHILSLVPGSRQNIIRRLQRLYHAGYLDRPKAQLPLRYAGELFEFVYSLTRKSEANESRTGSGKEYSSVSSLFLAHALAVSEVLVSVARSGEARGLSVLSESDILASTGASRMQWRISVRTDDSVEKIGVIPDGAFAVHRPGARWRLYFLLEVDRGTMPVSRKSLRLSSIRRKALAYFHSRRKHSLKDRFDIPGFQVLFVVRSKERLERMKEVCASVTEGRSPSLFLFAAWDDLKQANDPFAISWQTCAGETRQLGGT